MEKTFALPTCQPTKRELQVGRGRVDEDEWDEPIHV